MTTILKPQITDGIVTKYGIFDMQVCVPSTWTDQQVTDFANQKNPSGTENGWQIKKEGHESLKGDPERNQCADASDRVHIMLEC